MSTQDTSFEALAASPGDYAVDSEWMGDSPPALTVDFIQNPHNHIHHIGQLATTQQHPRAGAAHASGAGGYEKDPLLSGGPTLRSYPQPPAASSPDSFLSSYQDSSSDISSKQTSLTGVSSVSGTQAKNSRGRPRGSAGRSAAGQPRRAAQPDALPSPDEVMMKDEGMDASDHAQPDWNIRDYLTLDDDQDNEGDSCSQLQQTTILTTIDPKSIQRTPSCTGEDDLFLDDAAGNGTAGVPGSGIAASLTELSPFSTDPSSFDFVSATSSPNADDSMMQSLSTPHAYASTASTVNGDSSSRRGHSKAPSQYSLNQSMNNLRTAGSREVSPISNFVFSQGPSPTAFLNNSHSPAENPDIRFGMFPGGAMPPGTANFLFADGAPSVPTSPTSPWQSSAMQPQGMNGAVSQLPLFPQGPAAALIHPQQQQQQQQRPLRFFVGVTPTKSRVETQIPIMIYLSVLPPGVTKLHLPPHTISKPKLLAKTPIEPSPELLELHTMVVCTSAMQVESNRRRALERAAAATYAPRAAPSSDGTSSEDGDDCRPANGGEIWICKGCIQRERKRANRKKSKKPEDDEGWSRDEHRRIIIFNTNEIKDWQRPTTAALSSLDKNAAGSPIAAVISVPMRITCYCRHHGEKTGFQVIFTLKDCWGRVIAQTMSRSIMITDDHKTPSGPSVGAASTTAASSVADGDISAGDAQDNTAKTASATPATTSSAKAASKAKASKAPSASQATPDLPTLKRSSVSFSAVQSPTEKPAPSGTSPSIAESAAASLARNLSRPASPNGLKGHSSKKRKSSAGTNKVPTGLAMTRIETALPPQQSQQSQQPQQPSLQNMPNGAATRASMSSASPSVAFSANSSSFLSPSTTFAPDSMAAVVDMALMTGNSGDPDIDSLAGIVPMSDSLVAGPLTPNSHTEQGSLLANSNRSASFDNLAVAQSTPMYSAPASSHASRAPSPSGLRGGPMHLFQQHFFQQQQQQQQQQHHQLQQMSQAHFSQPFPAGLFSLPMAMSQATTSPTSSPVIHKIIPAEGPKSGGIEVTILGSAFYQGLDVMFGDQRATTTTFWGESSLVCLVPPSPIAGHVPVTLRQANQRQAQPFSTSHNQQRVTFKYLDDDEQQLLRAALTVLSRKMTGKIEDAQDVARRIIGSETSTWGTSSGSGRGSTAGSTTAAGGPANIVASASNPNFETQLLKVLELIDLDDSSNHTRLNMQRRTTGHSMLHLACALGMHRFVAGLLARGANPDVRDNGGYTPLHLAALNNQPEIVRRLIHAGADPTMRTLSGFTAAEVAASREVVRAIKRLERHARSRSGGSMHSRTSSAASLRSVWEPMSMSAIRRASNVASDADAGDSSERSSAAEVDSSSYAASGDDERSSEQEEEDGDNEWLDMRSGSRRMSRSSMSLRGPRSTREASPSTRGGPSSVATGAGGAGGTDVPAALASPATAAVLAFKEQVAAQFQQIVSQMPNNPLPDYYQAYLNSAAFQRISSLVPNIGGSTGSRPNSASDHAGGSGHAGPKEMEGRWWDLSSKTGSVLPPAYEEIFPHKPALDTKQAAAAAAAAEAEADTKCAALFDQPQQVKEDTEESVIESEEEQASKTPALLQIGRKHQITKEQQENFRRAHKEKRKGLGSDTFLYTVWIPILLGVLLLWLSGARAWDFFPSVTFNMSYATSLGSPMLRPTGRTDDNNNHQCQQKTVLAPPPAVAAVPNAVDGDGVLDVRKVGGLEGLVV